MLACGSRTFFLAPSAVLYLAPTMASHISGLRKPCMNKNTPKIGEREGGRGGKVTVPCYNHQHEEGSFETGRLLSARPCIQ